MHKPVSFVHCLKACLLCLALSTPLHTVYAQHAASPAQAIALPQQNAQEEKPTAPLPLEQLRLFAEVLDLVEHSYVQHVDDKKLLVAAIKGMVSNLDPHSSYLDENDFRELQEQTQGRFAGLGLEITQEEGLVKIISPIEDTPAARAGLRAGDLIMRIDGVPVRGMTLDKAARKMRGTAGTPVTLTLYRKTENRTFPAVLNRAEIRIKSVKQKMLEPGYAWLRITSFQENTLVELATQLQRIYTQSISPTSGKSTAHPLKGLVLDLRNNGGGLLQSAVGVAGAFLPSQAIVVSTNGQEPDSQQIYRNTLDDYRLPSIKGDPLKAIPALFKKVPLVVLTNAYSASASEIVAGALQDQKRATILGKTTFGKGSVQTVRPLTSDTGLRLTTAYYYTPSGRSIQNKGIHPDQIVDQNADGDLDDALITREADYSNHLANTQDPNEAKEQTAREAEQMEQMRLLELANEKKTPAQREAERKRPPIELGSSNDFMLQQALHYLKGEPVQYSAATKKDQQSTK